MTRTVGSATDSPAYFRDVLEEPATLETPEILEKVMQTATTLTPFNDPVCDPIRQTVILYKLTTEGMQRIAAYNNYETPKFGKEIENTMAIGARFEGQPGLVGHVAKTNQPVMTTDLHGEPEYDGTIDSFSEDADDMFHDAIIVPIHGLGVLQIMRPETCHYSLEDDGYERTTFSEHELVAFQEMVSMAYSIVLCPTKGFWGCTSFPHCPKCGWGAKEMSNTASEVNSVVGNNLDDYNPAAVEGALSVCLSFCTLFRCALSFACSLCLWLLFLCVLLWSVCVRGLTVLSLSPGVYRNGSGH